MAPCSCRMLLRYCMCWPNGSATMRSRHTTLEHCKIRHSIGSTDSVYQLCRMGCPCLARTMLVIVGVVCLIYYLLLRRGACISSGKHHRWSKAMCGNQCGTTIFPVVGFSLPASCKAACAHSLVSLEHPWRVLWWFEHRDSMRVGTPWATFTRRTSTRCRPASLLPSQLELVPQ